MMRPAILQTTTLLTVAGALEILTRGGWVSSFSMIPPTVMLTSAVKLLVSGEIMQDFWSTVRSVVLAAVLAICTGFIFGALVSVIPRVRWALEPLFSSYYATPMFVLYPILILLFGLNDIPKITIGFLYAFMAMTTNTILGIEKIPRIYRRVAAAQRLTALERTFLVLLPASLPYVFNGLKLAVAYAFLGVLAAEFILSTKGIGHFIHYSYSNYDNRTLYGTIIIVLAGAFFINFSLSKAESYFLVRKGIR